MPRTASSRILLLPLLPALFVLAGCRADSTGPSRAPLTPSTTAETRHFVTPGDVSIVSPAQRKFVVQNGTVSAVVVRVTERTGYEGVGSFESMVADYAAGYRMYAAVAVDDEHASEPIALEVQVTSRTGPSPVHFRHPANLNPWAGFFVLNGYGKQITAVLPWTTVRADSELATIGDIEKALTAFERVCVAGDGFTVGVGAAEAITIGAWHYTGDGYDACRDK